MSKQMIEYVRRRVLDIVVKEEELIRRRDTSIFLIEQIKFDACELCINVLAGSPHIVRDFEFHRLLPPNHSI